MRGPRATCRDYPPRPRREGCRLSGVFRCTRRLKPFSVCCPTADAARGTRKPAAPAKTKPATGSAMLLPRPAQRAALGATGRRQTNGCAWNAVSAFANCGRAVAHVRGSYVPIAAVSRCSRMRVEGRHYSITSSARASSFAGISRPSALAVVRLMTRSNLVGCSTGRSAGFSPLRMRPA